jgi:hypothetical protein
MPTTGAACQTRLIVLRGNSGSGKSSVAKALVAACGRGVAWVGQDLIRLLTAGHYESMLARLRDDHGRHSYFYYLDVSLSETIRRHATRPEAAEFGPDELRDWYQPVDVLRSVTERVLPETSTLGATVDVILAESGLRPVIGWPGQSRPARRCSPAAG